MPLICHAKSFHQRGTQPILTVGSTTQPVKKIEEAFQIQYNLRNALKMGHLLGREKAI